MAEITTKLCKNIVAEYRAGENDPYLASDHSKMLMLLAEAWLIQQKEIEQLKEKIEERTPCPLCNNEGEVAIARGTGKWIPASQSHADFVLVYDCPACAEEEEEV